jgi:hypothetical protein
VNESTNEEAKKQGGKTMKRIAIIAIAAAMFVPAAFGQKVRVDYERSHNFSEYRTYAWKGCAVPNNDAVVQTGFTESRIQSAVDRQLTLKEMRQVPADANPDVYFTCWIKNEDRTEVWGSTHWGPGWGGGYWGRGWGGWGYGGGYSTVNTTHYTEGTYVIDMVDAKTERLVWRANSTMRVRNNHRDAKRIEKMAERAFKKFPAGPAVHGHAVRPDRAVRGD